MSTSKSSTSSLVSSVPLRLPTAHTSLVLEARIRHTTPPLPPLSRVTRFRINSPVFRSHSLTVPSSELVMTKFLLNWRQVTALWCLWGPENAKKQLVRGVESEVNKGKSFTTAVNLHSYSRNQSLLRKNYLKFLFPQILYVQIYMFCLDM